MIDRDRCKTIRKHLEDALELFNKANPDIVAHVGNASYSHHNATFKIEIASVNTDGSVETKEARAFKQCAVMLGLIPENLGDIFTVRGQSYQIVGAKPRSPKYPILAERSDGKVFKFPESTVIRALGVRKDPRPAA